MFEKNRSKLQEIKWQLVGILGKMLIDCLFLGARIEFVGLEKVRDIVDSRRFILAFWHSRILLVSYVFKDWHGVALVSRSDDGEIIARILQRLGNDTIRGSTKKGGLRALARLIKCLKEADRVGAVIPDGPQGPRYIVQPGVITLAQKTGYPILPVTYSARKIKVFDSWDRFVLPWPFTRCRLAYGEPIYVPADVDKDAYEDCRLRLETELMRITTASDRFFGHDIR